MPANVYRVFMYRGPHTKPFIHLTFTETFEVEHYCAPFADEATKAQSGTVTDPRSHGQ